MFSETTSKLWKTNPPTCSSKSIARLQSYFFSGSETRHHGISESLPNIIMIIDTGYSCAEKTIMEARCSRIYNFILMLTWTGSDISAPICLLSGSRVRITANRKGWYTLLLEFPFFISLKLQMAVFKEVSFRSITNAFVSLNTLTQENKKETSARLDTHKFLFP